VRVAEQTGRFLTRGYPRASSRRKPLIRTLRAADTCVVGNAVLGGFALRYSSRVVEIPTTVDPVSQVPARAGKAALVWVGVADNLQYLSLIADPLARLRHDIEFRFTVVSSRPWLEAPIPTTFVRWTPEAERAALLGASVGVAPLTDDPWTRGKCAFRAILYGGHALATAATPVGITDEVLIDGQTGLLARTKDEWVRALRDLLEDPDRTAEMGQRAWRRVREAYSDQVALRMWLELLREGSPERRRDRIGAR
jgi:glycosyltransferase involved in cell wall biosynthesis